MSTAGSANWKYDLRYRAQCFVRDAPQRHILLRARTIDGAKEEAARRLPLRVPGDMLRILGAIRSGGHLIHHPITVAETVFPKLEWAESDEAQWFRMAEGEAELLDGIVLRKKKPRINPDQIKYIADALGMGERRLAGLVADYGDPTSEIYNVKLITLADAARLLDVSVTHIEQLKAEGRLGDTLHFLGRCFLRRDIVVAFDERRSGRLEYLARAVEMRSERLARRSC